MGSVLWEQKAPAGASSDTNIHIHRTPTHTSFNFMRHYCRDTKLGRLPLGFSWLQQREAWTWFRAGARTFLDGKVTGPPLPCPVPISTPPPTAASWCLPAQTLPLSRRNPALNCKGWVWVLAPMGCSCGNKLVRWHQPAGETWWLWSRGCTHAGMFGEELCQALSRMSTRSRAPQGQKLETPKWELNPASFGHQRGPSLSTSPDRRAGTCCWERVQVPSWGH